MGCNNRKKVGEAGEVKRYITRNAAVKKLQISLRDFRKLCILKGIYPREPKHRKKVQHGSSEIKTLYLMKDIQFLFHEPIIWSFRQHKAHMQKVRKAYNKKEQRKGGNLFSKKPIYRLDHIVRERYPTFTDALRDIDDPLTLCTLFSKLPRAQYIKHGVLETCRRMVSEFMLYVIESRSLRKVFISIKGYYYQAEIMGQPITWIMPHPFTPQNTTEVDLGIMKTFVEFYISLMGFVNFRLYATLNLKYPPILSKSVLVTMDHTDVDETEPILLRSLNMELMKGKVEEEDDPETAIDTHLLEEDGAELDVLREEEKKKVSQQNLFEGFKFFLNRETNLESLTFVIRSCGGQVSWEKTTAGGSTYPESDETITHQIVDRPSSLQKYLSRYYIQPQWVYDSINARLLLPIQDYFPGAKLPPHLSPFENPKDLYMPPEKKALLARQKGEVLEEELKKDDSDSDSDLDKPVEMPKLPPRVKAKLKKKKKKKLRKQRAREELNGETATENEAAKPMAVDKADKSKIEDQSKTREANKRKQQDKGKAKADKSKQEDQGKEGKPEGKEDDAVESAEDHRQRVIKKMEEQGVPPEQAKRDMKEFIQDDDGIVIQMGPRSQVKRRKDPVEMEVTEGKTKRARSGDQLKEQKEELRLNVMMIPKRQRRIYSILKHKEDRQERKVEMMTYKRALIDAKAKQTKRDQKRKERDAQREKHDKMVKKNMKKMEKKNAQSGGTAAEPENA